MYTFGLWKTIPDSAVYWDNFSRNSFNIVEVHRIVVYSLALYLIITGGETSILVVY